MKILHLRFQNLNSLAGEWAIDFSLPEYACDGIFTITGPTGAGKTTLLDAICLALYGRTPRLKSITASGNDIMSRQTGTCFAEVVFETLDGRFLCHWSQHRAHKKPDGNLAESRHEIADFQTGQVIETRKRDVARVVEEKTGMDFERFTRSMLLAQGGFAAFLQASPDERAPILEQITGTEIYSQVSRQVHERHREENARLDLLQAQSSSIRLLNPDDETACQTALQDHRTRESELTRAGDEIGSSIRWLQGIKALEQELEALDVKSRNLVFESSSFEPDRHRLKTSDRAAELDGDYAVLVSVRQQQTKEGETLATTLGRIPELEKKFLESETELKAMESCLVTARQNQKIELERIKTVRSLDLKHSEKKLQSKTGGIALQSLEAKIAERRNSRLVIGQQQASLDLEMAGVDVFLKDHVCDKNLVSELTGITEIARNLEFSRNRQLSLARDLETAGESFVKAQSECAGLEETGKSQESEHAAALSLIRRLAGEHRDLLQGHDIRYWRGRYETLKDNISLLETIRTLGLSLEENDRVSAGVKAAREALTDEIRSLSLEIESLAGKQGSQEREVRNLEKQVILLGHIRDLEAERARLEDGQPCPLCGALDHPFARGNAPEFDQAQDSLARARACLEALGKEISAQGILRAGKAKECEHADLRDKELSALMEQDRLRYDTLVSGLGLENPGSLARERVTDMVEAARDGMAQVADLLEKDDVLTREISLGQEKETGLRNALVDLYRHLDKFRNQRDASLADKARISRELDAAGNQADTLVRTLLDRVTGFGISHIPEEGPAGLCSTLNQRLEQWQANRNQKEILERKRADLAAESVRLDGILTDLGQGLEERQALQEALGMEMASLALERVTLFGIRDPDQEEGRMEAAAADLESNIALARERRDSTARQFHEHKTLVRSLEQSMALRSRELEKREEKFRTLLERSGFGMESDFLGARLSKEVRDDLRLRAADLDTRRTELDVRKKDRDETLSRERKKQLTGRTIEELSLEMDKVTEGLKTTAQNMGALNQKLADNNAAREAYLDLLSGLEGQRKECSRWNALHTLIGSADGKKYRNFAQGLTFELMVAHANRKLATMTDRYMLIRDQSQPLELNVVDSYQAGEIRSTKNLSGGESFIVSLCLALGLSQMASRKVRVDSLFLDEGFGTLDDETLDTALEALSGLRQDGKLIGIISHVAALKERISSEIRVQPVSGGRSIITGPGCTRGPSRAREPGSDVSGAT
ncbi:MAG: AAA family ATPase [Pseudomonadota bacterium]